MDTMLRRLGRLTTAHPKATLAAWVPLLALLAVLSATLGGALRDAMTAPDSSSERAMQTLRDEFPQRTGASAHVVAQWPDTADPTAVAQVAQSLSAVAGVDDVDVRTSGDGSAALLSVTMTEEVADVDLKALTAQLQVAAAPLTGSGARVGVGGQVPEAVQGPNGIAEGVGVLVALLLLVLSLGRVLAAGIPLVVAGVGLGAGMSLIMLLAAVTDVSTVSPTLGMMMGLGVGIDYGLFLVARHLEGLAAGRSVVDSAVEATVRAGHSVLVAGLVVLVAITGLFFAGVPGFATMGMAAGLVVLACVAAALTVVPALLVLCGHRLLARRPRTFRSPLAERLTRAVTRRPLTWLVVGVVALLALAAPALGMRLGQNDAGSERASAPTRIAHDLVVDAFGPGHNGPLLVVAPAEAADATVSALHTVPGVAEVAAPQLSGSGSTVAIPVVPATGPSKQATFDLVERLHTALPAGAEVTGATAAMVDTTRVLGDHLVQVVLAVLLATFVLLVPLLRSVLVPLKAVVVNLLSIGAAYGVMTLAFQTEAGAALLGLPGPVPIPGWAPVVLFGILFGMSMDYEVFLVSRVREAYQRTGDPVGSVVDGLGASAKVVTVSGAVMVAVALGFAFDPGVMVKIIGVGMAAAILVDVTIVRMLLVPAALTLMGHANWWLPTVPRRTPRGLAVPETT